MIRIVQARGPEKEKPEFPLYAKVSRENAAMNLRRVVTGTTSHP